MHEFADASAFGSSADGCLESSVEALNVNLVTSMFGLHKNRFDRRFHCPICGLNRKLAHLSPPRIPDGANPTDLDSSLGTLGESRHLLPLQKLN